MTSSRDTFKACKDLFIIAFFNLHDYAFKKLFHIKTFWFGGDFVNWLYSLILPKWSYRTYADAYSEPSRISKMELLAKRVNGWNLLTTVKGWNPLTVFAKSPILNVRLGSEYVFDTSLMNFFSGLFNFSSVLVNLFFFCWFVWRRRLLA